MIAKQSGQNSFSVHICLEWNFNRYNTAANECRWKRKLIAYLSARWNRCAVTSVSLGRLWILHLENMTLYVVMPEKCLHEPHLKSVSAGIVFWLFFNRPSSPAHLNLALSWDWTSMSKDFEPLTSIFGVEFGAHSCSLAGGQWRHTARPLEFSHLAWDENGQDVSVNVVGAVWRGWKVQPRWVLTQPDHVIPRMHYKLHRW